MPWPGEAGEAGAAQQTTAACRAHDAVVVADGDVGIQALAIALHGAQVIEQRSLDDRQLLQHHDPSAAAQQRLHQAEAEERVVIALILPGDGPGKRVHQFDDKLATGGKGLLRLQRRIRLHRLRYLGQVGRDAGRRCRTVERRDIDQAAGHWCLGS